ncbi:hypothetical protein Hte_003638 [Hypoxylon texense]
MDDQQPTPPSSQARNLQDGLRKSPLPKPNPGVCETRPARRRHHPHSLLRPLRLTSSRVRVWTTRMYGTRQARDGIAGVVLRDGKFRCGEALPNGNVCGSKVTNTKPAIARHINNLHNPNSSYLRRQNSSEKR